MTATRRLARLGLAAALLAGAASARASEAVIFSGPAPQAAELARILWPTKQRGAAQGATRSIRLNPDLAPAAAPRPASQVELAAAEPETATDAGYGAAPAPAAQPDTFGFVIRFAYDSAGILPESRPYLDSVGAMLRLPQAGGRQVAIVGHTDAAGSEQYNQALSERRAAAVKAYLAGELDIEAARLKIEGRGETDPLAGSDPYAAQNRRVEFRAQG